MKDMLKLSAINEEHFSWRSGKNMFSQPHSCFQGKRLTQQKKLTNTHLVMCFWERAMAYSATTVLPADVCAATNTESCASSLRMACFWKTSSSNGHWGGAEAEKQEQLSEPAQPVQTLTLMHTRASPPGKLGWGCVCRNPRRVMLC